MNNPFEGLDESVTPDPRIQTPAYSQPATPPAAYPNTPLPQAMPPTTLTPKPRGSKGRLWISIGAAVIALILGGGYYAYSKGYISIPGLTPKTDELFDKMVDSITDIKNAQYSLRVDVKTEPRSGSYKPLFDENKLQERAKNSQQISNVRQHGLSLAAYYDDNGEYPENLTAAWTAYGGSSQPQDVFTNEPYGYLRSADKMNFTLTFQLKSPASTLGDNLRDGSNTIDASGSYNKSSGNGDVRVNDGVSLGTSIQKTATPFSVEDIAPGTPYSIEDVGGQVGLGTADLSDTLFGDFLYFGGYDEFFQAFPADLNLSGGITINFEADKKTSEADGSVRIDGSYTGGDVTAAVDVEARKKDKNLYAIINKFPSILFIDPSAIKGKWIKFTPEDGLDWLDDEAFDQVDIRQAANTLKSNLKNALKAKVFSVKQKLPAEMIAGIKSEHYLIEIDPTKLPDLYQKLADDQRSQGKDASTYEQIRDSIKEADVMDTMKRIAANSRIEIWVDRVNGFLRQSKWELKIVPPEKNERLKNKQISFGLTLTLDKVNQSVNVDIPGQTIGPDEAERLLTGVSKEEQQAQKQISRINDLQDALVAYQKSVGSYPDSLDQLTPKLRELNQVCEDSKDNPNANYDYNCYTYSQYKSKPVNLTDVYTNKPYTYAKDGADFKVTYELHLGDVQRLSYYKDSYAEGKNTMNSKDLSLEKKTSYELYQEQRDTNTNSNKNSNTNTSTTPTDTDEDGLPDNMESAYNSSSGMFDTDGDGLADGDEVYLFMSRPSSKDSDADGFQDYEELINGYNPNGSGTASAAVLANFSKPSRSGATYVYNLTVKNEAGKITLTWKSSSSATSTVGLRNTSGTGQPLYANESSPTQSHQATFSVTSGTSYAYTIGMYAGTSYSITPEKTIVAK